MKRIERLRRSEKIPEGSVVRWFVPRENAKMGEERRDHNGMEGGEGSETSKDGRGKGGETVFTKVSTKS